MGSLNTPLFIVHVAGDFLDRGADAAGRYFKEEGNERKQYDNLIHAKLSMPVVNIVLSLELSLKGLIIFSGRNARGHDLLKLFDSLEQEQRIKIVDHYCSHDYYKKFVAIRLASGVEHSKREVSKALPKSEAGMRELLELHKNHFIGLRYLFEYNDGTQVVIRFRELLNLAFSALFVLGQTQNVKVEPRSRSIP